MSKEQKNDSQNQQTNNDQLVYVNEQDYLSVIDKLSAENAQLSLAVSALKRQLREERGVDNGNQNN